MINLPLNALRAFALAYQAAGIRSAARFMGISHSAVSRHIRELESWLGIELVTASGRRLAFTANGETLGRAVLTNFNAIADCITGLREARHADSVVVSTTASIAARWLLPRLPALQLEHPEIEVSVMTEQQLIAPDGERVDISLRMGNGPWPGNDCEAILNDELYPALHPSLLTAEVRAQPARCFAKYPLIHDRDPNAAWSTWLKVYPQAGIDPRKGARFASSDLVIRACKEGLGMGLVRARLAGDEISSGALVRPFAEQSLPLPDAYWILSPTSTSHRLAVEQFKSWLRRQSRSSSAS